MTGRALLKIGCVALAAFLLSGCGLSGCGAQPLAKVSGTVAYRGKPLHSGMIVFTPDAAKGTRGPIGFAKIQADGSYTLYTGDAAGAVPGWHRITVVSISEPEPANPEHKFAVPVSLIPERYRDPDMSGLTREIKPSDKNVFHLNLD